MFLGPGGIFLGSWRDVSRLRDVSRPLDGRFLGPGGMFLGSWRDVSRLRDVSRPLEGCF